MKIATAIFVESRESSKILFCSSNSDLGDTRPGFCPNPRCALCRNLKYFDVLGRQVQRRFRFKRKGTRRLLDGTVRRRFLCLECGKNFSSSIFDLNYRLQKRGHISSRIFFGVVHNRSNLSLARELSISEHCVRLRIRRMARIGLMKHAEYLSKVNLEEELAYDGLEAFAYSQYEPCNINQVLGAESLFTYVFNFAPMNRKGRMSERQRDYLKVKEQESGRFDPKAIRRATLEVVRELLRIRDRHKKGGALTLRSDEHFQYRRALNRDLSPEDRNRITHRTVNSKECRNYKNILFSVNHLDMLIRRKVAAFTRETICFSKKPSALMEKYILYICYKNYMRPAFTKKQKRDLDANIKSPAMRLGLEGRLLNFGDLFYLRYPGVQSKNMPLDWAETLEGRTRFERSHKYLRQQGSGVSLKTAI